MKQKYILLVLLLFIYISIQAQSVGIGTSTPAASAQLDVSSTSKGMLIPRMTSQQRLAIASPEFGLLVFDTDQSAVMFFDGQKWRALSFTSESNPVNTVRSADEPVINANYGFRVASSGNYCIVSSPTYRAGGTMVNAGAAYILYKGSNGWTQQAKLVPADSASGSFFGGAVAISGDYAVVAATTKTIGANSDAGKVYVYKRTGSNWTLDAEFTKPSPAALERFGYSVAINADIPGGAVLAVGVPFSKSLGTDRGEIFCYKRNINNTWASVQTIRPAELADNDRFGSSLSMDGDYLAAGAPLQSNGTSSAGAAYVFVYGGGVFTQQTRIVGTVAGASFGLSLSLHQNRLAVGAPWATPFNGSAIVNIYTRNVASWPSTGQVKLNNIDVAGNSNATSQLINFGMALSLRGNDLLIGAPAGFITAHYTIAGEAAVQGAVYHYRNISGNSFSRINTIYPQGGFVNDMFGSTMAIADDHFIIGNAKASAIGLPSSGSVVIGSLPE